MNELNTISNKLPLIHSYFQGLGQGQNGEGFSGQATARFLTEYSNDIQRLPNNMPYLRTIITPILQAIQELKFVIYGQNNVKSHFMFVENAYHLVFVEQNIYAEHGIDYDYYYNSVSLDFNNIIIANHPAVADTDLMSFTHEYY